LGAAPLLILGDFSTRRGKREEKSLAETRTSWYACFAHCPWLSTPLVEEAHGVLARKGSNLRNTARRPRPFTDFQSVGPDTDLDSLDLSWRERDLPERVRTKHVHRLHPYLGKFIPQLVEIFLRKYEPTVVCDPFCGSGTTLVEATALGIDSIGCDISAFNCLLSEVKTGKYDLDKAECGIKDILGRTRPALQASFQDPGAVDYETDSEYLQAWFAPEALWELLCYRSFTTDYEYQDLLRVILSRAARSARLTTHYDLDFPKKPQTQPYFCYKHSRICKPTRSAIKFLRRYSLDTMRRLREFAGVRMGAEVTIIHGDARIIEFPPFDMVITSPPYVGLIDYHEQHRYAYELLGLPWKEELEIGAALKGTSQRAKARYQREIAEVFSNVKKSLSEDGVVVVVVGDRYGLYDDIADLCGFYLETRLQRQVNRRTGRRAGDFYESILIWRNS